MEDKCPFCGAGEVEQLYVDPPIYRCATSNGHQSWACTQFVNLRQQLQEAKRLLDDWIFTYIDGCTFECQTCKLIRKTRTFLNSEAEKSELCIRCGKAKATRYTPEGICEKCWQEEYGDRPDPEMDTTSLKVLANLSPKSKSGICTQEGIKP